MDVVKVMPAMYIRALLQRMPCTTSTSLKLPTGTVHIRSNSERIILSISERFFPFAESSLSGGNSEDGGRRRIAVMPSEKVLTIYDESAVGAKRFKVHQHDELLSRRASAVRRQNDFRRPKGMAAAGTPGSVRYVACGGPAFPGDLEMSRATSTAKVDATAQKHLDTMTYAPFWTEVAIRDGTIYKKHRFVPGAFEKAPVTAFASHVALPPVESGPNHAVSSDGGEWILFGDDLVSDDACVDDAIELAWVADQLFKKGGVWIRGDVVSLPSTHKSVLLVGPRYSGKTSLALHAVNQIGGAHLTAADSINLFLHEKTGLSAAGFPRPVFLAPGTLVGSLCSNKKLTTAFPRFDRKKFSDVESEDVLWNMQKAFHAPIRDVAENVFPYAEKLSAVVFVNWAFNGDPSHPAFVRQLTTSEEQQPALRAAAAVARKSHRLVLPWNTHQDDFKRNAEEEFVKLLTPTDAATDAVALYELAGGVAFEPAVRFLRQLLS